MRDIVAVNFSGIITNDPAYIVARLRDGTPFELLERERMQLMAMCDLGPRWTRLALGPTLFVMDDAGRLQGTDRLTSGGG